MVDDEHAPPRPGARRVRPQAPARAAPARDDVARRGDGCWPRTTRGSSLSSPMLQPLSDAVASYVRDGDTVALEGFTHLIPHAAGHELIRQGRRDLTLVRMTPDVIYDQLIGMGCARKLVFSWGGNPGVGSLHRLRDAVENGWPAPLELEEHSHAGMAAAYAAGAAKLPFGVLRGYAGHRSRRADAGRDDRLPVHRRGAERRARAPAGRRASSTPSARTGAGTSSSGASSACRRRSCSRPARSIVTVEEVVDELTPRARRDRPAWRGCSTPSASLPAARIPPTRTATTTATTSSTSAGTRSAATGTRSASGSERHVLGTDGRRGVPPQPRRGRA